jgi:hypothetical protein
MPMHKGRMIGEDAGSNDRVDQIARVREGDRVATRGRTH